jgi:RimJ/RimL family protein N-acetyltransferase
VGEILTRILVVGDEPLVEAFLLPRLDSSMLLFGNIQARGLAYRGQRYEGIYAGAFDGPDMIGVVAHYWNQNLILQAPAHLKALVGAVSIASGRPIEGLLGPDDQVQKAKNILGWSPSMLRHDEVDKLYRLKLSDLIVPEILATGHVRGRLAKNGDIDLLAKWRVEYLAEIVNAPKTPDLIQSSRQSIMGQIAEARTWVIEHNDRVVATSSFNVSVQSASGIGIVQVGGVWTPPPLRKQGFGRAAVATSLVDARNNQAKKAILFTGESNIAAQRAYSALGFEHIGAYRLTFPHQPAAL